MRPAVWMATALAVGILVAEWLRPHPVLALAAFLLAVGTAAWTRGRALAAVFAAVALFGCFRYAYDQTAGRGDIGAFEGQKVAVVGTVTEEPELRQPRGVAYVVAVERVNEQTADGLLYVVQYGGSNPRFGERIAFAARFKPPAGPRSPGGFDQAAYLARKSIFYTADVGQLAVMGPGNLNQVRRTAVATRTWLEETLRRTLPQRDAALLAGLLFGSRTDLPEDLRESFRASGVFHLLAVSGGNIALVLTPLLWVLHQVGWSKRRAAAAGLPFVIFFVFLTGASPSVVRAGLMAVLVLLGHVLGREKDARNTLGAAVFMVLLWSPTLAFDIGFQLSVAATLGIMLFNQPIDRFLARWTVAIFGNRPGRWVAAGLSITLAAQLVVEPISLHYFGAFSTIAPLANLLVLALLSPITIGGWLLATLGRLPFLPTPMGYVMTLFLWALVFLVKATAAVPGAFLDVGRLPLAGVLTWYAVVVVVAAAPLRARLVETVRQALAWLHHATGRQRYGAVICVALVVVTGIAWNRALADPPDTLRLTVLDVGQGDAILLEAPGGDAMLIDAGPAAVPDPDTGFVGHDAGRDVVLPFLRQRGIEHLAAVVLTHPHQDHAGGLHAVFETVPADLLLDPEFPHDAVGYREALDTVHRRGITVRRPVAGESILLGPSVSLDVLHPGPTHLTGTRSDENSNSIVLRLRYRDVTMLLAGDMEAIVEEMLLAGAEPLKADVLKVAHHGSEYSSTTPFLDAVQPKWAIISAGAGNLFGHPSPGAIKRLQAVGSQVLRTDQHGAVTVKTDGQRITVTTDRGRVADPSYRPVGILGRRLLFAW